MTIAVNTIRHTILGKKFTADTPVVDSKTRASIEGYMEIKHPSVINNPVVSPGVYAVQPPTETDPRYIRTDPSDNLAVTIPDCVVYNIQERSSGRLVLFWRFLMNALGTITQESHYSIEFNIEDEDNAGTALTPSVVGNVIVRASDSII